MTVTTTFDPTLSRVKIDFTGQPLHADYAIVDRSLDGITWHTVRGGDTVPLTAGVGVLYDYEFAANVLNTYRVRAVDTAPSSLLSAAGGASAVNAPVIPVLTASPQPGDCLILVAAIRNSGTGVVDLPAGWTALAGLGTNFLVAARDWGSAGFAAPTVTFTGGAANQETHAFIVGGRNCSLTGDGVNAAAILNASAQDVTTPAFTVQEGGFFGRAGWKQDDLSAVGVTPGPVLTLMGQLSSTAGDDSSMFMLGRIADPGAVFAPSRVTPITGGAAAISRGIGFFIPAAPYITQETQTLTPPLSTIWLKNVTRPNLNTAITVVDFDEETQASRDGLFTIVGRTFPIAVTEVRASRQTMITVKTETLAEAEDFRLRLMTGEPCFLHTPDAAGDCPIPSMYVAIGETTKRRPEGRRRATRRYWDLPLTEVAQPVSTFVGTTITYQDVLAQFATYADILPAEPTYSDLLDRVGTPGEVIIP